MTDHEHRFGTGRDFSLGVEEELFLVDPVTGAQIDASAAVLERLGPVDGSVERELHACQVELITDVCTTAGEAAGTLGGLRRAVCATGAGLLGSGTHPASFEGTAQITDKDRYERIRELLGDAVADPVGGLHVHVGMPDPETAIRAFNGLRRHLPLLQALSANSPFRHGRDTGLASAREVTMRGWPRSGVPRAMRDFEDFCVSSAVLARPRGPRLHVVLVEAAPAPAAGHRRDPRARRGEARSTTVVALVALVHSLAREAATAAEPPPDLPAEILDEGAFRAARYGTAADLPCADGRLRPVAQVLDEALAAAAPHARDLDCADELDGVRRLLRYAGGAGRQRAAHAIGGLGALLRETVAQTGVTA